MTHLLDSSAVLTVLLRESGEDQVKEILSNSSNIVGISVLTLFEVDTAVFHRTGSQEAAEQAVEGIRQVVQTVIPLNEPIVELARELRRAATVRIATVDVLIAATAVHHGAILVHRDPHFAALPAGRPVQEVLPAKA